MLYFSDYRTMNELILFGLLTAYLVALTETSSSGPNQQVGLDVQKFGHRKHIKVSVGKQWEEREGQWSAGFYVKHSKNMPPDQPIIRDNQAGVELKGHFKG
ncbi:unnamed protein product [Nezara viridula]|uniref:Neuropeptide n=1 Tax=Nezara viridula TaxID=85310 RepID=A0A9P0H4Q0_NEZVI|nr:unnamed protein product [Nezara viridula]